MTLHEFNLLPADELRQTLFNCCGSTAWVNRMLGFFPMDDLVEMLEDAEEQWYECTEADWREAFTHHPKIGDMDALEKKFAATAEWAADEQAAVATATRDTIVNLAKANHTYEEKFGYIFIVCATGKSAEEMLDFLNQRLVNTPQEEIRIAMDEQNKITLLRLQKTDTMSQITTHILDTSRGKPAWGVAVILYQKVGHDWIQYAKGTTNSEGRITNLLPEGDELPLAIYKLKFDTIHYFNTMDTECFYPVVEIIFDVKTLDHYHIPLLLSPYGYSTYRGS